jgi:ferric-dicitrate binding protein FerR (iron transport regulator)
MLHRMGRLSVRTPTAVCAIRGTEADIEQKDIMTVKVYEGHVELKNSLGKQALKAGQMSTVAGAGAAPAAPRSMTAADLGKWQEDINVKDIGKYLQVVDEGGNKKLKLMVEKEGKTKQVDINLKKK